MSAAIVLAAVIIACAGSPLFAAGSVRADRVDVYKAQRVLRLVRAGEVVASYRIALGAEPVGPKTRQGDERTPEGSYLLDWRNEKSAFYRSIHISYPNAADIERAAREGVPPGGDIMIHGLPKKMAWVGRLHRLLDWTDGCIAVTNDEMDEIWAAVGPGTPIQIYP